MRNKYLVTALEKQKGKINSHQTIFFVEDEEDVKKIYKIARKKILDIVTTENATPQLRYVTLWKRTNENGNYYPIYP